MVQPDNTRERVITAFRARIVEEMALRGLRTPEDLAHFAGVTKNTGYNWHGGGLPRADGLAKLVEASGISADYWLGLSDVRQAPAELSQDELDPDLAAAISQADDPAQAVAIAQEIEERLNSLDEAEAPRRVRRKAR